MSITKNSVANYFKKLERFGFKVLNFQSNSYVSKGSKGMTDLLILGNKKNEVYFIEIKIGKDKLSFEQKELGKRLSKISNYFIATETNYYEIFDKILKGV